MSEDEKPVSDDSLNLSGYLSKNCTRNRGQ